MSVVGQNQPHDSAAGHVSGESIYVDDMPPLFNEVLVDFFYSPVSHGRIKNLDLTEALKVPGIVGIYTYKDIPGENRLGKVRKDEVLLVEELCEFIGHPIAVIAGENRQAINNAKKCIKLEVEPLKPILTIDDAIAQKSFMGLPRRIKCGDLAKGFAEAEHVIEGRFFMGGQEHFYLESQVALAVPGEDNQLVVHSSTQNPNEGQDVIAHVLGLRQNQVVVISKRMGGGFGGKEYQATQPAVMAALVAMKTKRPARIVFNKDDDMQVTGKRHPFQNDYKVGFTKDGLVTALEVQLFADGGAFLDLSIAVLSKAVLHTENAYYLPNFDVKGLICKTHYPPNTAFRGFGSPQGMITIEAIMEEVSCYLKKDALAVRRLNSFKAPDRNVTSYGATIENNSLDTIYDQLTKTSQYQERLAAIKEFNAASKTHLKGIAATPLKFGVSFGQKYMNQASALVNIYLDGTIQVSTGATEMGQGVNTNIRQLVAGEFDLGMESVLVMATSTEKNNNASPTAASSATDLNGQAAVDACRLIRQRLIDCARKHFGNESAEIVFDNGTVYAHNNAKDKLTFRELVSNAYLQGISLGERAFYSHKGLHFNWETGDEKTGTGHPYLYYTFGLSISEVLIDRFTGDLEIPRVDILMDLGRAINPGINRGQVTGAFIQGMGWTTTEALCYDDKGWLMAHSPTTYKIPNIQDTPAIFNVDFLDTVNTVNVAGSKAVGEPPFLLGASVFMAVKHALSFISNGTVPRLKLPATNEEILACITSLTKAKPHGGEASKQPALTP